MQGAKQGDGAWERGFDLTVALNAHAETVIAGPTMHGAEAAIRAAAKEGYRIERLIGLDAASDECLAFFAQPAFSDWTIVNLDKRDLGLARNALAAIASGRWIAFLDADDLFSENWLLEGARMPARRAKTGEWLSLPGVQVRPRTLSSPCGGTLKIIAASEEPTVITKILGHLGLPSRHPRYAILLRWLSSPYLLYWRSRLLSRCSPTARTRAKLRSLPTRVIGNHSPSRVQPTIGSPTRPASRHNAKICSNQDGISFFNAQQSDFSIHPPRN